MVRGVISWPRMPDKKTVLVVDDSPAQRDDLAAAFEEAGYAVGLAADGEEVLRKLGALEPDALVLDLFLPRLDGAEVCRMVKSHPRWRESYLVLVSARISDAEVGQYRRLGADAILHKPLEPEDVLHVVRGAIGPP